MKQVKVSIKGITPLLMHRFASEKKGDLAGPGKRRSGVPDWEKEGEIAAYRDDKGKLYQPATHIECAMKEAAKNFKVSGKRGATYSKLVASTLSVVPDAIPHKIQDYEIDSRPVVVQRARVTRYRPILKDWELDFILELPDDQLQVEVVKEILDYAGLYVGIGDFRPGKGGKFGKFMVTEFKAK